MAMGYHPYDATHVITQLEILLSAWLLPFNLWGKYPPELPSVNLDVDWITAWPSFWDWERFSGMVRTTCMVS